MSLNHIILWASCMVFLLVPDLGSASGIEQPPKKRCIAVKSIYGTRKNPVGANQVASWPRPPALSLPAGCNNILTL